MRSDWLKGYVLTKKRNRKLRFDDLYTDKTTYFVCLFVELFFLLDWAMGNIQMMQPQRSISIGENAMTPYIYDI